MSNKGNETELYKLIQQEHNLENQVIQEEIEGEDMQQSYDIDAFETKMNKNKNSDSDDEEFYKKLKKNVQFQSQLPPKQSISEIQSKIMTEKKQKVQNSEEFQLGELLKNSGNDGMKEKKIKELFQRNKNLQVQYESEKSMRIKMENQINQMIKDNDEAGQWKNLNTDYNFKTSTNSIGHTSSMEHGTKNFNKTGASYGQKDVKKDNLSDEDYKKKFQDADKKVQELRVKLQSTKNDLNKANRVISKEIGDNFDIDKVLMEENSWKGRAQQIEKLHAKVKELNAKLGNTMNNTGMSGMTMTEDGGTLQFGKTGKQAQEKRQEQEAQKELIQQLKQEQENLQQKVKGLASRKNILENEIKDYKNEYEKNKQIFMEKSNNDDKYISALKAELERMKKNKGEPRVVYKNQCQHDHRDDNEIELENRKLKKDLTYIQDELEQKEKIIKELIENKIQPDEQELLKNPFSDQSEAVSKLQTELKIYKKEREEFLNSSIKDKDSKQIIKDLSLQNAKLRNKIDDLQFKK